MQAAFLGLPAAPLSLVVRVHSTYVQDQPSESWLIAPYAAICGVWALVGALFEGGYGYFSIALVSILLCLLAVLPLIVLWRVAKRGSWPHVIGTYVISILIVPVVWYVSYGLLIELYAWAINQCCLGIQALENEIWWSIHLLSQLALTFALFASIVGIGALSVYCATRRERVSRLVNGTVCAVFLTTSVVLVVYAFGDVAP